MKCAVTKTFPLNNVSAFADTVRKHNGKLSRSFGLDQHITRASVNITFSHAIDMLAFDAEWKKISETSYVGQDESFFTKLEGLFWNESSSLSR